MEVTRQQVSNSCSWSEAVITFKAVYVNGRDICKLMRIHKVTMRDLKARTGFTLTRIREARSAGLVGAYTSRDWVQAITGTDPGNSLDHPMIHKSYR